MKQSKKVLITGVTGMDGSHMVDYLLEKTDNIIIGGIRRLSVTNHKNISHINDPRFRLIDLDVTDQINTTLVIQEEKPDYFINFAANSFVGSSWKMPVNHMMTNAMPVMYQLEAIRRFVPDCRYYNAGCYDSETKIVTKDGIKSIEEVEIGDYVPSLNLKTKNVEYKRIKKLIKYDYKGKMLHFEGLGKDILVTPNHNILYEGKSGLLFCRADEFIKKAHAAYPSYKGISFLDEKSKNKKINLTDYIPEKSFSKNVEITEIFLEDLIYLMGVYVGDGSSNIMERIENRPPLDSRQRDEHGRFTGVYSKPKRLVKYSSARCILDVPETDPAFLKITEILDRNKINWSLHGQCDITFFSWGLYHFFDQCGHKSNEKNIPDWIFDLSRELQEKFFEGVMDSDGHIKKMVLEQTSQKLAEQLIILGTNIGLRVTLSEREPRSATMKSGRKIIGKHKTYINSFKTRKICYQKNIKTDYYSSNSQYKEVDYDNYVWCLEVEDNHNFLVIRNGKTVFCGNSSEEFGDVDCSPQDINHPLKPRSPYGVSKCAARHMVKVWRESYNLYAVQGLLFNHEGVRRGNEFITRKISLNVARIKKAFDKGINFEPICVGNLDSKRDWSYSVDFVDGIWKMLNQETPKDYVLASGECHSIKELIEIAFDAVNIKGEWVGSGDYAKYVTSNANLVMVSKDLVRPAEVNLLCGDSTPARNELGWKPSVSFKELVQMMVLHDYQS